MNPQITCAIPTYNSAAILWLQLESLCRQEHAPPFEIVIYEERSDNYAGQQYFEPYKNRLEAAGCKNICYVGLRDRMPLPEKWRRIALAATAPVYLLCASDNYSPPDRLKESYAAIMSGADWYDTTAGHFYNIHTGEIALLSRPVPDRHPFGAPVRSGLFMATRTEYVAALPDGGPPRGIDAWMKSNMPIKTHRWADGPAGLHTDGHNQISHYRAGRYAGGCYRRPFSAPVESLAECVPVDVADRLINMQEVTV